MTHISGLSTVNSTLVSCSYSHSQGLFPTLQKALGMSMSCSDNHGRMKEKFTIVNHPEKVGLSPVYLIFVYLVESMASVLIQNHFHFVHSSHFAIPFDLAILCRWLATTSTLHQIKKLQRMLRISVIHGTLRTFSSDSYKTVTSKPE